MCSKPDCNRPSYCRGMCTMHYSRWYNNKGHDNNEGISYLRKKKSHYAKPDYYEEYKRLYKQHEDLEDYVFELEETLEYYLKEEEDDRMS